MKPQSCRACATLPACILAAAQPTTLDTLEPAIASVRLRQGDRVDADGRLGRVLAIVKLGTVFIVRKGLDGASRPIGLAGRGAEFGLYRYFGQPNPVSLLAAEPVRLCEIRHDDLRQAAQADPSLASELSRRASACFSTIASWSEGMRLSGVANQLAYSLLLLAQAQGSRMLRLPTHASLADLLGTSRESIARAFATLKLEGGLVLLPGRHCEIRRETLLRRLE